MNIFDKALLELSTAITYQANKLMAQGYAYTAVEEITPRCYQETTSKHLTICSTGYESNILGQMVNMDYRFWYTCTKIQTQVTYNELQQLKTVAVLHKELESMGLSELALDIFQADTVGQIMYHDQHKALPQDQTLFVNECLIIGIDAAINSHGV